MDQTEVSTGQITPLQQMISSCTGAMLTSLFVTPLDVVKIRLQAQQKEFIKNKCFLYCNGLMDHVCYCYNGHAKDQGKDLWYKRSTHFNGTLDAFMKITKNEGISSLWSGLPPTLVMAIPATVLYFTVYDQLCAYFRQSFYVNGATSGLWIPVLAGGTARIFSATLISPLEMIRTKMQSKKLSYSEIGIAVKQLVKSEGIFSLWKGLNVTLLRDVPFSCLYWLNYENCKQMFKQPDPSFGFSFLAGAFSGSVAALITLPFDVVKTHRQIELGETVATNEKRNTRKTFDIMQQIYRERGYRGLFAGIVPRISKVAPACAIMISTYECGKAFFRQYNQSQRSSTTSQKW